MVIVIYALSNTYALFETRFIKNLSNTEAKKLLFVKKSL